MGMEALPAQQYNPKKLCLNQRGLVGFSPKTPNRVFTEQN
jgi:hypothetical protein